MSRVKAAFPLAQAVSRRSRSRSHDDASSLLRWYDAHKRDLPWRRREQDAYAQLVAEVMLQQTQVATVIPFYERFLKRFPTAAALAKAPIDDVLTLWAGLGYYRRARNLHAAAVAVIHDHGGHMPTTVEGLMTLPGIGRYTAGAIASITFGVRAPILDGNVARVLMRLSGIEADPRATETRAHLWKLAESMLPARRCGDFNQALMELGATVCSPQTPNCLLCPLSRMCTACLEGTTDRIPPPSQRTRVLAAAMVVAAVRRGDEWLFIQRPATGLWAGLWELPSEAISEDESPAKAWERLRVRMPPGVRLSSEPIGSVVRQLTHRKITFHIHAGTSKPATSALRGAGRKTAPPGLRWLSPERHAEVGISRACRAILRFLDVHSAG